MHQLEDYILPKNVILNDHTFLAQCDVEFESDMSIIILSRIWLTDGISSGFIDHNDFLYVFIYRDLMKQLKNDNDFNMRQKEIIDASL